MKEVTLENRDDFLSSVHKLLGYSLTSKQESAFFRYEKELITWNSQFNLTAIRDVSSIRIKHFLDSLSCLLVINISTTRRLVDIGTGAGFPGIPIKILHPDLELTLVESIGKKSTFCKHIVEVLGLNGVDVIQGRAEDLGQMPAHREKYDWAVARAVAIMSVLAEYLLPLVKISGAALAQKGKNASEEVARAQSAIRLLGGRERLLQQIHLPDIPEERYLVVLDKIKPTPSEYPRRAGFPGKKPLI